MTGARWANSLRVTAATAAALAALPAAEGVARPARVHPSAFGRVFEANRGSVVSVVLGERTRVAGFVVGAAGELVLGAGPGRDGALEVECPDGTRRRATLLGEDPVLGLAVARLEGGLPAGVSPVRFAARSALEPERWVVTVRPSRDGRAEPFAGVVARTGATGGPRGVPVDVPGAPGAPVFSVEGELVGVSLRAGARRTRVLPAEALASIIRRVVAGASP